MGRPPASSTVKPLRSGPLTKQRRKDTGEGVRVAVPVLPTVAKRGSSSKRHLPQAAAERLPFRLSLTATMKSHPWLRLVKPVQRPQTGLVLVHLGTRLDPRRGNEGIRGVEHAAVEDAGIHVLALTAAVAVV